MNFSLKTKFSQFNTLTAAQIEQLKKYISQDPYLSPSERIQLVHLIESKDFWSKIVAGIEGGILLYLISLFFDLPEKVRILLLFSGFGLGTLIRDFVQKKRSPIIYEQTYKAYKLNL